MFLLNLKTSPEEVVVEVEVSVVIVDKLEDDGSRFKLLGERKILPRMCLSPRMELFGRLPHQIEVDVAFKT